MTVAGYQPKVLPSVAYYARERLAAYTTFAGNAWNTVLTRVSTYSGFALIDAGAICQVPTGHRCSSRLTINGADPGDTRVRNEFAFSGPITLPNSYYVAALVAGDVIDFDVEQENALGSINVFAGAYLRIVGLQ